MAAEGGENSVESIIATFETLQKSALKDAVQYLSSDQAIAAAIDRALAQQIHHNQFTPSLFQWLSGCAQSRQKSSELFTFVVQFTPTVILVYLHAIYETMSQLKANTEALLLTLVLEAEKEQPPPIEVPLLTRPSIYHQVSSQPLQSSLTEAALLRHNQPEVPPPRPSYVAKDITVNNRLRFLSTVVDVFGDRMTLYSARSLNSFCEACRRLALQGMGNIGGCVGCEGVSVEAVGKLRRYAVDDSFITSLLRCIRMCLFQSCHSQAKQALRALKIRAEYDLLTSAILTSHALIRLSDGVEPQEPRITRDSLSTYAEEANPTQHVDPHQVHTSLNSHLLHHKLTARDHAPQPRPHLQLSDLEASPSVRRTVSVAVVTESESSGSDGRGGVDGKSTAV